MRKRLLSLALAALMLTGCAGGKSSAPQSSAPTEQSGTSGSEKKQRTELTVAFLEKGPEVGIFDPKLYVKRFNDSQDEYTVKVADYADYAGEDDLYGDGMIAQFKRDVVAGKAPDIVVLNDRGLVEMLSQKGAFADLDGFMENDPEVNRDTLMPNVLKALESSDGCLYSISPQFKIRSAAVKKKFGQRENWTVREMIDFYDNAPSTADHLYDYTDPGKVFDTVLSGMDYLIDYGNAACHFDSDDFVDVLEFCSRFKNTEELPDKLNTGEWESYSYDRNTWLKNDRDIFESFMIEGRINNMWNEISQVRDMDFCEDITLVGYPSSNGHGGKIDPLEGFSILDTCPDKEGAWQFIRYFFTKDAQSVNDKLGASSNNRYAIIMLRTRKDCFEEWLDTCRYFTEWSAEEQKFVKTYNYDTYEYHAEPLNDEDVDDLRRYVLSCDTVYNSFPSEVTKICMEEAESYFSGRCSARDAAEMIQNRASLWISEQS